MKREVRIVVMKIDGKQEDAQLELNQFASRGFRIVSSAGAGLPRGVCWMWTLERDIDEVLDEC